MRVTCRDPRSSSEKISITSSFPLPSLSRLTPFPLLFPPSAFTEGPGESSGDGDGTGDWGIIPCAFNRSTIQNSIRDRHIHQNEKPTSFPIQEAEGQPRGNVDLLDVGSRKLVTVGSFSKPGQPG